MISETFRQSSLAYQSRMPTKSFISVMISVSARSSVSETPAAGLPLRVEKQLREVHAVKRGRRGDDLSRVRIDVSNSPMRLDNTLSMIVVETA